MRAATRLGLILAAMAALPAVVNAQDQVQATNAAVVTVPVAEKSQWEWTTNADNTITVTKYTGSGGEVAIPDRINGLPVAGIGYKAFCLCTNMTSVTIPYGITNIGYKAFHRCINLTDVAIPDSVTRIEGMAFRDCHSLTNITIGPNVTNIGVMVFEGDNRLEEIEVDPLNPVYASVGGALFDKRQTELNADQTISFTRYTGGDAAMAIPGRINGRPVTSIGNEVFRSCGSLTNVTIGSNVPDIGDRAFSWCTSLGDVTIPASVTNVGSGAFRNCSHLTNVVIGPRVVNIGDEAFSGCFRLTSVTIPSSVTNIGERVFANCESLMGVYFKGDAPSPSAFVFNVTSTATVYHLEGTKGWEDWFGGRPTAVWRPEGGTVTNGVPVVGTQR